MATEANAAPAGRGYRHLRMTAVACRPATVPTQLATGHGDDSRRDHRIAIRAYALASGRATLLRQREPPLEQLLYRCNVRGTELCDLAFKPRPIAGHCIGTERQGHSKRHER